MGNLDSDALALLVLLWSIGDGQAWYVLVFDSILQEVWKAAWRTWWEGLLELVGLLGILEDKGVKVTLAADLELDGRGLLAALDASRAGVLAAADLDEVLDVGDFSWHFGGSRARLVVAWVAVVL